MKNKPVMLNLFQHLIITILCGVLICIGFTSCENFLNGAETKEKLEQLVKEANAPKVQIYIKADEKAGSVSPAGLFECKLDSSFLILFEPKDGYEFLKWEVVDRNTGDPLIGAVVFEDETKNETRVTVKKNIENIRIQPVYVTLPSIISVAPAYYDSGVYANMPIEVGFNIPMINEDGSAFNFSYENISIVSNGNHIEKYFYAPELNNDGKSLKILPKALDFQEYILNQGKRAIDVQVSFKTESISLTLGENNYYLFQNANTLFSYRVNSTLETELPLCDHLSVSRPKDGHVFSPEGSSETQFNDINVVKEHAVSKYINLSGEAFDSDSGVKSIVLEVKPLNDKSGIPVTKDTERFVYEKNDLNIIERRK